jgi:two-component system NtrC family sensor kinase
VAFERLERTHTRLVDSAEDAIATIDEDGRFTSVNRALEKVSGKSRAELVGTNFVEILRPSERADLWRLFAATLGGERQRKEVRFTRPDGAQRVAAVLATPLVEDGRVTGVLAVARDVTDERNLQEQVVRREKLVALGELVSGVAHEMNAPLQAILSHAQLIERDAAEGSETREAATVVGAEARRAARIVGKLLTFARQNPAERLATDLNAVVEDTLELRRYPLRVQEIVLQVELDRDLPLTWADPFQLQQALINILGNAEQAVVQQGGPRRITVRSRREGETAIIAITDSGPGIAPEHFPHIFNPFYTTKPRGSGTGLGLSIADGIVRDHGGTIRVQSEPGKGATFELALPIVPPPAPPSP